MPAAILVRDGRFYALRKETVDKIYETSNEHLLVDYLSTGYQGQNFDIVRARPSKNTIFYEYAAKHLSDNYFTTTMEYYSSYRKFMKQYLWEPTSLKKFNPNFGKKNSFQKS